MSKCDCLKLSREGRKIPADNDFNVGWQGKCPIIVFGRFYFLMFKTQLVNAL